MHLQSSHSNKDTHSIKQNIFKKFLTRYKYNHKIIHWLKQSLQYLQQNSDAYSSLQIVTYDLQYPHYSKTKKIDS